MYLMIMILTLNNKLIYTNKWIECEINHFFCFDFKLNPLKLVLMLLIYFHTQFFIVFVIFIGIYLIAFLVNLLFLYLFIYYFPWRHIDRFISLFSTVALKCKSQRQKRKLTSTHTLFLTATCSRGRDDEYLQDVWGHVCSHRSSTAPEHFRTPEQCVSS